MIFSLNTTIVKPEQNNKIHNAVILLHGYGGDGKDISILTLNWKRFLPNTVFLCPDAHETCSINPSGFQWFDLSKDNTEYIIQQSLEAEKVIWKYIKEVKEFYKLKNSQICLLGFSQGCMMSINIGLTADENFNCVIGFSGKIINKDHLSKRISSSTKMLLFHGDKDEIVPPSNLLEAKDFLLRNKIKVEINMISNCDHHIPVKASSIALNYLKKNFFI
tara:strand:+ start:2285 stop:2941 length:657 start_codon:yes stop_codon:yes gene_type:complete